MKELVNSDRRLPNFSVWSVKAVATQQDEGASEVGPVHAAMGQFSLLAHLQLGFFFNSLVNLGAEEPLRLDAPHQLEGFLVGDGLNGQAATNSSSC